MNLLKIMHRLPFCFCIWNGMNSQFVPFTFIRFQSHQLHLPSIQALNTLHAYHYTPYFRAIALFICTSHQPFTSIGKKSAWQELSTCWLLNKKTTILNRIRKPVQFTQGAPKWLSRISNTCSLDQNKRKIPAASYSYIKSLHVLVSSLNIFENVKGWSFGKQDHHVLLSSIHDMVLEYLHQRSYLNDILKHPEYFCMRWIIAKM